MNTNVIKLKTSQEIATLAEGGKLLASFLEQLANVIQPGVTGQELDKMARNLCRQHDVIPAFLGYQTPSHPPYEGAICVSINEAVVHGVPADEPFVEGDLVGLDMGIVYQGLYLDSAHTIPVGDISDDARQLLDVTREALRRGIAAAQLGNTIGHIGEAVQSYVERHAQLPDGRRFGVVRQLVGHGVGYDVHEDPQVPNFGRAGEGATLEEGLVIAIEPMVVVGDPTVKTADDGWTIVTESGNLSAHEEHTVAITAKGPLILTVK